MSNIEWTEQTWNVIIGCSKISDGCRNCYAINQAYRNNAIAQQIDPNSRGRLGYYQGLTEKRGNRIEWTGQIAFVEEALDIPLKRKKPTIYFVNSMGDLFHEDVTESQLDRVFAVMAQTPQHTYQVLTKRPMSMLDYIQTIDKPLSNVWLGTSLENQKTVSDRTQHLYKIHNRGWKTFYSCEPLLEEIELYLNHEAVDWVICGAESGHGARPFDENWARSLRDQCVATNTPFFYKQKMVDGHKVSLPELDGVVWNQKLQVEL